MNAPYQADPELEKRLSGRLLDVFIRAGAIFALAVLCYNIFAPFISLMAWALILAVALYPLHQKLARKMGANAAGLGRHRADRGAYYRLDAQAGRFSS
jgi:hypothetical protein